MRIVMVTPAFPKQPDHIVGGVMGVVKYLTDELVKLDGVELSIVSLDGEGADVTCHEWDRYKVYRLGRTGPARLLPGTLYDLARGKRELFALLERLNPDIVHFQGCEYLAANCDRPHVVTIHGIKERDALWRSPGPLGWLKWLLLKLTEGYGRRTVPHIILISEYVRKYLRSSRNLRKTWLIENPIADSFFEVEWRGEQGRIFACGTIIPRKNVLNLIKAFELLHRRFPEAQLRLGGSSAEDPAYAERCRRYVSERGIEGQVHFLGNLSVESVQAELAGSSCLAIPSHQETAPLSIEEAMAVGVPVVGSAICGLPYMIEEGVTGFLVDPNDVAGIARAIGKIVADRGLAASMSRRSQEVSRKRFKASDVARSTMAVYREVLGL